MAKDFSKLVGLIYEKYGSQAAFSEALGKPADWISRRLNNKVQFNGDDMILVCECLVFPRHHTPFLKNVAFYRTFGVKK